MIKIKNLDKSFGELHVLKNVSFRGSKRGDFRLDRKERRREINITSLY